MTGFLASFSFGWLLLGVLTVSLVLGFLEVPAWLGFAAVAFLFAGLAAPTWLWIGLGVCAAVFLLPAIRRAVITKPLMRFMKAAGILPVISDTERQALEAGTVWVEGELFGGNPNFGLMLSEPLPELTEEEQAFLDGPVERICALVDDWRVYQDRRLPEEAMDALKQEGVFGMVTPKEDGGLGFSPAAVSSVIGKLSARSTPLGIFAMIPNSLGPAELIHSYGTPEQKKTWLPRLASGEEIPCFALTEPMAGSDAGSITSSAEVFRGEDGRAMLRLNWDKRYITLVSQATVLGLAVQLTDPSNLLGKGFRPGITAVLVPAATPGVVRGERHDPLGVPFVNCPTQGHDVVVPADSIIGGPERAGDGWRMLMECLAAGRGVMLPAQAAVGAKLTARGAGAYSAIRKQFGLSIGKFEGIQEPLARIGGRAYLLEAARRYVCAGLAKNKPAVVSAIAKYYFTETFRKSINDAMDVLAGAGISCGPRNILAHAYIGVPISITVEGANILTRTMMIFGQGAIRCHPYAFLEIDAMAKGDVVAFDRAFFGHIKHIFANKSRTVLLGLSRGHLARVDLQGPGRRYAQKIAWSSAQFAYLADIAMASLGGDLKRREALTGRFSDVLGWMFLATSVLRRFEADGRPQEDLPFYTWSLEHALAQVQEGFDGIYETFEAPVFGPIFRTLGVFLSRINPIARPPSDHLGRKVATLMQLPGSQRDRLFDGIYLPEDPEEALGRLEQTFVLVVQADAVAKKIRAAQKAQQLPKGRPLTVLDQARDAQVISVAEHEQVLQAEARREDAVQVDSFDDQAYFASAEFPPAGLFPDSTPPELSPEAISDGTAKNGGGAGVA